MFDYFKKKAIINRSNDELLYEYVLEELEKNIKVKGLWAKAYANSDGNEKGIEPLYMKYRVQSIKDAFSILQISYNEYQREQLFHFIKNKLFNEVENISLNNANETLSSKTCGLLLDECIINNKYIKENNKVYTLTKDGLVLKDKGYATYNYEDSINRLTTTTEFSKYEK